MTICQCVFDGLVVLQLMESGKVGFWSLIVMNASVFCYLGILRFIVIDTLKPFENDLYEMLHSIKLTNTGLDSRLD